MHGYVDKDGDGWRDQPDGEPLVLEYATSPDQQNRQLNELWKKNMDAIGIKHHLQDRQVAREPEGQPRRQADDVGRGLERRRARRRHLPGAGLWPQQGQRQPRALQPAGLQCAVRKTAPCCPTAPSAWP
jgi:hypothetical protein